jgi:hypothetical protein
MILTYEAWEEKYRNLRGDDKPVEGKIRLSKPDDSCFLLRYNGSPIIRIYQDGRYAITDAGRPSLTYAKILGSYAPTGHVYRRDSTIYFGYPMGRFSVHDDWTYLEPSKSEEGMISSRVTSSTSSFIVKFNVSKSGPPDPRQIPRWTDWLISEYAAMLYRWILDQPHFTHATKVNVLSPQEMAEYIVTGEPNLSILYFALQYKTSKKRFAETMNLLEEDPRKVPLEDIMERALKSISKEMQPTISDYMVQAKLC